MITRIEVDGFKSLRSFAVDLEPLTAIVGPNGVGKSNLFDALQLLSGLARGNVTTAFGEGRGSSRDQFSRVLGDDACERMSLAVELLLASPSEPQTRLQSRVRYEIEIERATKPSGVEVLSILREKLLPITRVEDIWMGRHAQLAPLASYEAEGSLLVTLEKNESPVQRANRLIRASYLDKNAHLTQETGAHLSMTALPGAVIPLVDGVGEAMRGFRFLRLEPSKLRLASDRAAPTSLAPDGANLPTALAAIEPEARAEIRADLARLIPSFKSFHVLPVDDEFRIEVELTSGQRLSARVLSDGTLRLLALFLLLRTAGPGALVAIEEPENGIHPGGLRALVEELVEATTPRGALPPQVLLNSHSPALVAALHHRPDSLVFADLVRDGNGPLSTRMRHVWREGDAQDRGATTVSMREVERILDTARSIDEVA